VRRPVVGAVVRRRHDHRLADLLAATPGALPGGDCLHWTLLFACVTRQATSTGFPGGDDQDNTLCRRRDVLLITGTMSPGADRPVRVVVTSMSWMNDMTALCVVIVRSTDAVLR
jgi:hypothetical protein